MKKLLILLILIIGMTSCENETDVKTDLQRLKIERTDLIRVNSIAKQERETYRNLIVAEQSNLEQLRIEKNMIKQGKEPNYILKFRLKQSHFTMDVGTHIKDGINSIEFDMPVPREFYNSVHVGSNIVDEFRMGSFIMNGSFGDWNMKVIDKQIK